MSAHESPAAAQPRKPASTPAAKPKPSQPALPFPIPPILLEGDETVAPPAPPAQSFLDDGRDIDSGQLPEAFGTGKLLLIPRDPTSLYAAWDFTADQQQRANAQSIDRHMVLLIWNAGPDRQLVSEIHVHPESRHWFATMPTPGETYCAEIGYYDRQRNWCAMAHSSAITTPRSGPAPEPATFEIITIGAQAPEQRDSPATEAPTRTPDAPSPAYGRAQQNLLTSPTPSAPTAGRQLPSEWTDAAAMEILAIAGLAPEQVRGLGSIEILELLARSANVTAPAPGPVSSLEAAQLPPPEGQPEVPGAAGISSLGAPQPAQPAPKDFWFQVNAELVVYGATEPDAIVTIGGRQIHLREDGTFSYRFSLPDGAHQLPIQAMNRDGDSRAASMTFSRSTTCTGDVGVHPQDASLKKPGPENVS